MDEPTDRPAFATARRVRCQNKACAKYEVDRIVELPHLGDGVYLGCTTGGAFGLPMPDLVCGTCGESRMW